MSDEEKIIQTEAEAIEKAEQPIEETEQTLPDLVTAIKEQYEAKIATLSAKHAKDVAERDAVITQLMSGEQPAQTESIADRINGKRNYKKW